MYKVSPVVRRFAAALLGGAGVATLWVNLAPDSYYDAIELRLLDLPAGILPAPMVLTPASLVSEALMALFLAFIGKELWEALVLERGALAGPGAALPLAAIVGGLAGAALAWLAMAAALDGAVEARGWVLVLGSDVVLCHAVGRQVLGPRHPGLHVLLTVTIAMEMAGILAIGLARPDASFRPAWLALPLLAVLAARAFVRRDRQRSEVARGHVRQLWPWVLAGLASWLGVLATGLPGALGLLPVIPAIPHARRNFGLFAEAEGLLHDPLNQLTRAIAGPVAVTLFLFGLTRGGILPDAAGPETMAVLAAVWLGKPLGILAGVGLAARLGGRQQPQGLAPRDWLAIAPVAGISLTAPLLGIDALLPGGLPDEAARFGLAIGLVGLAGVMLAVARLRRP